MKIRFILLVAAGLFTVAACSLCSRGRRPRIDPSDPWLTPDEAYEDRTAHTGMDGGAFVTDGLRIRDPRVISREEGYTPEKYCLHNGMFVELESGQTVYRRISDGLQRRTTWAWRDSKPSYLDESGCTTHDTYAFDGYKVGSDGTYDSSVPRLTEDLRPRSGVRYTEEGNPGGTYLLFSLSPEGKGQVEKVMQSVGFTETFSVDPFGFSTYALQSPDNEQNRAHLAIFPGGEKLVFTSAGSHETYVLGE